MVVNLFIWVEASVIDGLLAFERTLRGDAENALGLVLDNGSRAALFFITVVCKCVISLKMSDT